LDEPELEADSSDFPGRSELRPAWAGREKWSARLARAMAPAVICIVTPMGH
jgi:hypothetical protein